jgi:hypothetical protein
MRASARAFLALTLTLAASVCSPPAIAQTSDVARDHAKWCNYEADGPPNKKLDACTAMIDSGKYAGNDLADIMLMRARVYEYNVLNAARALADYDRTIKLNPNYAPAYYFRSLLHTRRGNTSLALADLN